MITIKIEVFGNTKLVSGELNSQVVLDTFENDIRKVVGQMLYSLEVQGFAFETNDVYEDVMYAIDNTTKYHNRFTNIYTKELDDNGELKVSIRG